MSLMNRVIEAADIDLTDSGHYALWTERGYYPAHELRLIADELDRLNAGWDRKIREELGKMKGSEMSGAEQALTRIVEARSVVRMAKEEWDSAKEAAKEAKQNYDDAVSNLTLIIDRSNERELEFPE